MSSLRRRDRARLHLYDHFLGILRGVERSMWERISL